MNTLNIFVVHSDYLVNRIKYLNSTLDMLTKMAENNSLKVNILIIKEPTKEYIETNIDSFNAKVKYEPEEGVYADEQFNKSIQPLNVLQISNIEKHKIIYDVIDKQYKNDLNFIMEDDVVVGEDYLSNIQSLLYRLRMNNEDWDILFTCISDTDNNPTLTMKDSRKQFKMLLSKSSYFIKGSIAKDLYKYLEIYKYNLKTGISKFIWDKKHIKSYVLNKHTFLEGSKFGLFTSSINNSNFLFQNADFVQLARITSHEIITDSLLQEAEVIYKRLEKLNNPDVLHTIGLIYFKRKDLKKAKDLMSEACHRLQECHGYVSKSHDILNNAINIYQHEQLYLNECKQKTSKYAA